jgi:hypothetical protein
VITKLFKNKLRRNGFITEDNKALWSFEKPASIQSGKYRKVTLVGIRIGYDSKITREILSQGDGESEKEAKINAMKAYIDEL